MAAQPLEWWKLQQAHEATGFNVETIRKWALADPPRVRSRLVSVGKRPIREVVVSDVRREAALSGRHGPSPPARPELGAEALANAGVGDLEEVLRRYRAIDELRQQIETMHQAIETHQSDIATILQGPTHVPNN